MDFRLLRNTPILENNGQLISSLSANQFEVLIYLVHQREEAYQRDYLIQELWGSYDKHTQKSLSNLLSKMPDEIKDDLLVVEDKTIYLKWENIEVDTINFMTNAELALRQAANLEHQALDRIEGTLRLYQYHFLEKYLPQIKGLVSWREEEQLELAQTRNILLETLVRLYIHYKDFTQAKRIAQQWLKSLDAGPFPLKYLIWLTANQSIGTQVELHNYLRQLKQYEEADEPIILEPNYDEWRAHLTQHTLLPTSLLRLNLPPEVEIPSQYLALPNEIVGRDALVRHVLNLLTSNVEKRLIALTGLPGVGKSAVLYVVANTIATTPHMPTPLHIFLSSQSSFMHVLDSIAEQLDHPDLRGLDFETKKQRTQHILQSRPFVIMVDDYDGISTTRELIDELVDYVGRTPLLVATPSLADIRFQIVAVESLTVDDVRVMLKNFRVPHATDKQIAEFVELTQGIPLLIDISLSFLSEYRYYEFAEMLQKLRTVIKPTEESTIEERYHQLLIALQQNISLSLQHVVQLIALFDPLHGVSEAELLAIRKLARSNETLDSKIALLLQLSLIQKAMAHPLTQDNEPRYGVHASVRRFLLPPNLTDTPASVLTDFVAVVVAYVDAHHNDFTKLDKFRLNIERALHLICDQPAQYCSIETHTILVQRIYYYLERRGLYELSIQLLHQTFDLQSDTPSFVQLELNHMLGKTYTYMNDFSVSTQYLEMAMHIAKELNKEEYYAKIYLDMAIIDIKLRRFLEAKHTLITAYALSQKYGQTALECRILLNLGTVTYRDGDYFASKNYYQRIIDYLDQIPVDRHDDMQIAFSAYQGLGLVLTRLGQFEDAQKFYLQATQIIEQMNDPIRTANLFLNIGFTYYTEGEYDSAYHYFTKSIELAKNIGHAELLTLGYWNIASIHAIRHDYSQSEINLRQSLMIATKHNLNWIIGEMYVDFGKLYLRQLFSEQAQKYFIKSIEKANKRAETIAEALYGLLLNQMLTEFPIGSGKIEDTRPFVHQLYQLVTLDPESHQVVTIQHVKTAHKNFVRDINEFPELARYCITDALIEWLGLDK